MLRYTTLFGVIIGEITETIVINCIKQAGKISA